MGASTPQVHIPLAATFGPLAPGAGAPRAALDRLQATGFRRVQLSAAASGMRPRELDRSARRDLLATLRRRDMLAVGLDAWIPPEDLAGGAALDRALGALLEAIELAADLGRLPLSLRLPEAAPAEVEAAVFAAADARDVRLMDHAVPPAERSDAGTVAIGIDPAAYLAVDGDPVAAVLAAGDRLGAARLVDLDRAGMRCAVRAPAAGGRLDVEGYRVALSIAGYRAAVVVDARRWADPWAGLDATVSVWGAAEPVTGGGVA